MLPSWLRLPLRLPDRLPLDRSADALYVPGLCLTHDKRRLTATNVACMKRAASLVVGPYRTGPSKAECLIFSGCYNGEPLKHELALRRKLAEECGIKKEIIVEIRGIKDTKDELKKLSQVLRVLGARSVLFVTDEYHMPRLVRWARLLMPGVKIFHVSVQSIVYEFAWEPEWYKVTRSGIRPLWILWNVLLYFLTPFFVKGDKNPCCEKSPQ